MSIDEYGTENYSGLTDYYPLLKVYPGEDSCSIVGQTFTPTESKPLGFVKFYLRKWGELTGTMKAELYATTGSIESDALPIGSPLAYSKAVNVAKVPIGSYKLITFHFLGEQRYSLVAGTCYVIAIKAYSGDFDSATGVILVSCDRSNPTHEGSTVYYIANWGSLKYPTDYGYDTIFYLYSSMGCVTIDSQEGLSWEPGYSKSGGSRIRISKVAKKKEGFMQRVKKRIFK